MLLSRGCHSGKISRAVWLRFFGVSRPRFDLGSHAETLPTPSRRCRDLGCGHCICQRCVASWSGPTTCPIDRQPWQNPHVAYDFLSAVDAISYALAATRSEGLHTPSSGGPEREATASKDGEGAGPGPGELSGSGWIAIAPRLPERREQQPDGRELDAPSRRHQTERHLPKPAMQWAGKNFVLVSSDTH